MAEDLRVPVLPILAAFGVPAVVTRPVPDDTPIATTAVWVSPLTVEMPLDTDFQRRERQRILALPVGEVPTVPRGTVIEAPEVLGENARSWRMDGVERTDREFHRVFVVEGPELE